MALSPQVKAAAVGIAGNYALYVIQFGKERGESKPMSKIFADNFGDMYSFILKTIAKEEKVS